MTPLNSKSESGKTGRATSFAKTLLTASAASTLAIMAFSPAAHAQVVLDIDACADFGGSGIDNPGAGDDSGATITIDTGAECTISSGDHIDLNDGQDNTDILVVAGTILTNTDTSDEDVVFFVDNAENVTNITIEDGAVLNGANGVIFGEGDELNVLNFGEIRGTGDQEEGVIYIDRDTDGPANFIRNRNTGVIVSEANGPAIGIETLLADGEDDAENVGAQSATADFPTVVIFNHNGGLIEANGTVSDDNDAINIAGNPGSTGGFDRDCIETVDSTGAPVATPALNCIVNLRIENGGIIRANYSDTENGATGTAAITIEDDALFVGTIRNRALGLITGDQNGIRIGDIVDNGETAEHDGEIINFGTISGTGLGSRGIDLEGDGITITNQAGGTISGVSSGIAVGAGTSGGVSNSGLNNEIRNSGTISGGTYAIDSDGADGFIRILNFGGGVLDGTIRGSVGNVDRLRFAGGDSILTHDVLQDFRVSVLASANLIFDGDRTIDGSLLSSGTVTFDIGNTQTINRNLNLRTGSTINITDTGNIGGIGNQYTLATVGGTLTSNASITDESAALDFIEVLSTDLVVEAIADSTAISQVSYNNPTIAAFGGRVFSAFSDGTLNGTDAFSAIAGFESIDGLGGAIESLAPDFSGSLAQNVFHSIQGNSGLIDQRLNDLNCNAIGDGAAESCLTFAETGSWVQFSDSNSTQGSLSSSTSPAFNNATGSEAQTFTYGYDHALDNAAVLGFSGSYTRSNVEQDFDSNSFSDLEIAQFGAYAGQQIGNVELVSKASYTHAEANTRRQAFEVIQSDVEVTGLNVHGTASYNARLGNGYYAKPHLGLQYSDITTSAFSETGGLNLNIDETSTNVLEGRVGLTLGARKALSDTTRADYYVTGALRNDFYGERTDLGFAFAGQTGSLAINNPGAYGVQGLAGVNFISGENFSFGGAVNGEVSDEENSVGGSVQTKIRW